MKVAELYNIDEGWKEKTAGALAAAVIAGGALSPRAADGELIKHRAVMIKKPEIPNEPPLQKKLRVAAEAAGIRGVELAQFLAQAAHETMNFRSLEERGSKKYFRNYDRPERAKVLGNQKPGDGERYKGRGYLQITGKYNYTKAGEVFDMDFVKHPELLANPDIAAKVAIWYWKARVRPHVANFENTKAVTFKINPALHGLKKREDLFSTMKDVLSV